MEFNYGQSSIASDKLQKAIERNRRKQAQKGPSEESEVRPPAPPPPQFFAEEEVLKARPTRAKVGLPDEIQFTRPEKKQSSARPAQIVQYVPVKRSRAKKARSRSLLPDKLKAWPFRLAWGLVFFLAFRLITVERGVLEYRSHFNFYESRAAELDQLLAENQALGKEIQKIKTDHRAQKKLARDHLGFIAPDEFLILFPEGSKGPSI